MGDRTHRSAASASGDDEVDYSVRLELVDAALGNETLHSLVAAKDLKKNRDRAGADISVPTALKTSSEDLR